ncbi:hypothetical protein I4F81_004313 [Pyropia yezoensis]|uniref:Uncharacterized protein n=1 Tax=Pyropia yezoensis TaxID=2788 RepID=A0ACC3BVT3_PYRYE|nr:hypothetical protein I4F81_004313 [Neopyropia yezoensis]
MAQGKRVGWRRAPRAAAPAAAAGPSGAQEVGAEVGGAFLTAARAGRAVVVRQALAEHPSVASYADAEGVTPLHAAAAGNHAEVAKQLLRANAPVDAKTGPSRLTPLHVAAAFRHKAVAEVLLAADAHVDAVSRTGQTPLHVAARNDHREDAEVRIGTDVAVNADTPRFNVDRSVGAAPRAGYTGTVMCLAVLDGGGSGGGARVVSGSSDSTVRVWDVDSSECTAVLTGHSGRAYCLAVLDGGGSGGGARVVSGSYDYTVRVWDVDRGECTAVLTGHSGTVYCLAVLDGGGSGGGARVVSGSYDYTVRVWDVDRGECMAVLSGHTGTVHCLAVLDGGGSGGGARVVSGSDDYTVRVWDVDRGECTAVLNGHTSWVYCLAELDGGGSGGEARVVSGSDDCTVRVWDVDRGECTAVLNGHTGRVYCLAVLDGGGSGGGARVVSGSDDYTVRVWDVDRGECTAVLTGHSGRVYCLAVLDGGGSGGGARVVSGSNDRTVRVWDVDRGKCTSVLSGHTDTVYCLAVLDGGGSGGGARVVSGSDDCTVRVWDMTLLSTAASARQVEVTEVLLCANASVEAKNKNGLTPLAIAIEARCAPLVQLLLTWGADLAGPRPRRPRALMSAKASQVQAVIDQVVPMTETERETKKAAWRDSMHTAKTALAVSDRFAAPLAALQAEYDRFLAEPTTLSLDVLKRDLTPPRDRDVRWHLLAHRLLLLAVSEGVFEREGETHGETFDRQQFWFRRVYQSALTVLSKGDHGIFEAVVHVAKNKGLIAPWHVSDAVVCGELHARIDAEVANIHRRLNDLEEAVTTGGQQLYEQLQNLVQYIRAKEERDRKVALTKSVVKIGVSLAPVVGGVLSATVEVMAEMTDILPGGKACLMHHLADPMDLPKALDVLALARQVEAHLSDVQLEQVSAAVHPFESVVAVEEHVRGALAELKISAEAEGATVTAADDEVAGNCNADDAVSDAGSDPLEDVIGATRDAAIEHGFDQFDERRRRPASPTASSPAGPLPPPAGVPRGRVGPADRRLDDGDHAPTTLPLQTGPASTASVSAETRKLSGGEPGTTGAAERSDRLVASVARLYSPTMRAELATVVREAATAHCVTGEILLESTDVHEVAICLLGRLAERRGVLMGVKNFIGKVQRFAEKP